MRLTEVSRLASELDGVAERTRDGLLDWRLRGRLVARQLDDAPGSFSPASSRPTP